MLRILITGVGRGLGLAMTETFIELGHVVIGCSRQQPHVDNLKKRFGQPHRFDAVDVADEGAVGRWAKAVLAAGGAPDLLLNNAAIVNRNAPLAVRGTRLAIRRGRDLPMYDAEVMAEAFRERVVRTGTSTVSISTCTPAALARRSRSNPIAWSLRQQR